MYTRKTRDEYHVQGNYGGGFETVTICDNIKDARQDLRDYIDNVTRYDGTPFRIVKKRVAL